MTFIIVMEKGHFSGFFEQLDDAKAEAQRLFPEYGRIISCYAINCYRCLTCIEKQSTKVRNEVAHL